MSESTKALFVAACFLAQGLWLAWTAPLPVAARQPVAALVLTASAGAFAFWRTRHRWDSHLDMLLLMAGPGGLGMLAGTAASGAPSCHAHALLSPPWMLMTFAMLALSLPPSWLWARCLRQPRTEGWAGYRVAADIVGMILGMEAGTAALKLIGIPMPGAWLGHGIMLVGMMLGSAAAMMITLRVRGSISGSGLKLLWRHSISKLF